MTEHVRTVLSVRGMTCNHCVRHVSEALSELNGVDNVEVDLAEARAVVQHDPAAAPLALLLEAVADAGYDATKRE